MLQIANQNQLFIAGLAKGSVTPPTPGTEDCILLESTGDELLLESVNECVLLETSP